MLDPTTLTGIHTLLSLAALAAGSIVTIALLGARMPPLWTALFLATAVATSATGFAFPFNTVLASHVVGAIALVLLAVAILALYVHRLAGAWRSIYALATVASVYLLVFVGIAQAFLKVPALAGAAPTLSEPPFAVSQLVALVLFAALAIAEARRFRPDRR